jgi:hypothetical protein
VTGRQRGALVDVDDVVGGRGDVGGLDPLEVVAKPLEGLETWHRLCLTDPATR